jgi:hypothetical protein
MDVGVAEINKTLSRDLGVVTRAAAVDDDAALAVGQQGRSQSVDLVGRNVHRSRKVCVVEIGGSQCLYQGKGSPLVRLRWSSFREIGVGLGMSWVLLRGRLASVGDVDSRS